MRMPPHPLRIIYLNVSQGVALFVKNIEGLGGAALLREVWPWKRCITVGGGGTKVSKAYTRPSIFLFLLVN